MKTPQEKKIEKYVETIAELNREVERLKKLLLYSHNKVIRNANKLFEIQSIIENENRNN